RKGRRGGFLFEGSAHGCARLLGLRDASGAGRGEQDRERLPGEESHEPSAQQHVCLTHLHERLATAPARRTRRYRSMYHAVQVRRRFSARSQGRRMAEILLGTEPTYRGAIVRTSLVVLLFSILAVSCSGSSMGTGQLKISLTD